MDQIAEKLQPSCKKTYETPVLRIYGDIRTVTLQNRGRFGSDSIRRSFRT